MLINLKEEKFLDEIKEGKVVVDFYAEWCGPCKMLGPVIEELSKEETVKFIKVNIDLHENLAREYGVMSVPTLILFEGGKNIKQSSGFMPKEVLVDWYK